MPKLKEEQVEYESHDDDKEEDKQGKVKELEAGDDQPQSTSTSNLEALDQEMVPGPYFHKQVVKLIKLLLFKWIDFTPTATKKLMDEQGLSDSEHVCSHCQEW